MADNKMSQEDLDYILSGYRQRNLSESVIALAESDLKGGLSKGQVALYTARRLEDVNARAMSEALHMGISPKLVKKLAMLDECRIGIILDELRGGMSEEKVLEVLSKDSSAHGMEELFSQIKEDMANAGDDGPGPENDVGKGKDSSKENTGTSENVREQANPAFSPEDIAKAMEPMLTRLMDGRLNMEIDRLEKKVQELTGDLASSAGVIKNKEDELLRLRKEMEKMKERKQEEAAVPKAAKPKKDAAASNGAANYIKAGSSGVATVDGATTAKDAVTVKNVAEVRDAVTGNGSASNETAATGDSAKTNIPFVDNKPADREYQVKKAGGSMQGQDIAGKGISIPEGTYQTVLTTPDGKKIPVQIERTSPRKPKGMLAMAARLFKGTPAQKALLNMLIESRLDPAQLKEIKRAKDSHFTDEELKDLIESDLPAEEMAGIIDVIISDR